VPREVADAGSAVGVGISLREERVALLVDGSWSEVSHSVPSGSPFGRPVQRCPKMMVQLTPLVTAGLVGPPTIVGP
jgi:hypothetical protein